MLNDKIENVQVFDAIVKKYAQKAIEGKTDAELTAMLRELAKRFDSNFDTLFIDYQATYMIDDVEKELNRLEKTVSLADDIDCGCEE